MSAWPSGRILRDWRAACEDGTSDGGKIHTHLEMPRSAEGTSHGSRRFEFLRMNLPVAHRQCVEREFTLPRHGRCRV